LKPIARRVGIRPFLPEFSEREEPSGVSESPVILSTVAVAELSPVPELKPARSNDPLTAAINRTSPPLQAGFIHILLVLATVVLTVWRSPGRDALRPGLSGPSRYLIGPLSIWDGSWYAEIARNGYGERQMSTAFWPLYPFLTGIASWLTGWSVAVTGVLLSNLAFVAALLVLHRLVSQSYGQAIATRSVWLVALCPVAFVFSALYSESLFFLLSLSAIYLSRNNRWTLAALALFLATLTRSTGVLVVVPMLAALIGQMGWNPRRLWKPGIQLAAALAGPLIFVAHLNRLWGDPFLMVHIQTQWHRTFSLPWTTLWTGFRRTELIYITGRHACIDGVRQQSWPSCRDALGLNIDSLSDDLAVASTLAAIAILLFAARKLIAGDLLYLLAAFLIPLLSTTADSPLLSMPRFLLVAYPLFIALAIVLQRRWLYIVTLGASACGLCWLLSLFARAYFVA
jgi:hypothetical protein